MANIAAEMAPSEHQSPPHSSMSSLEALIQAAQYLEDSESSEFCSGVLVWKALIQASQTLVDGNLFTLEVYKNVKPAV